jgi:hypothetical protein
MLKLNGAWLCGLSSVPQGSGLSRLRSSVLGNQKLAAHGLEEHVQFSLIFAIIVSFMLFTVFTLANVLYFE